MSAEGAARSIVSTVLLVIGFLLLVVAAIDFLEGYGVIYSLIVIVIGVIFLAISNSV